jgi:hypothetical protein
MIFRFWVAKIFKLRSLFLLNLSRLSCSITESLRCGQSEVFLISLIISLSYYWSFTSEILRRRDESPVRAAWNAVATEGKINPW